MTTKYIDIEKFRQTERQDDPFQFMIVPEFLKPEHLDAVNEDFPPIERAGNFPLNDLTYAPRFNDFVEEVRSPSFRAVIEEKFDIDLGDLHHLISIRAFSHKTDGNIHTDAPAKKLTALIYLNEDWNSPGGRLRLLRNADDIEDFVAEVPPIAGTLLMFKRSDNSWHGHKPFVGPRRAIQINWVTDAAEASKRYRPVTVTRRLKRWLGLET
jgi:hypothetical protein